MKKRRFPLAGWIAVLLCAPMFGCGQGALFPLSTPTPAPTPTVAPTPTPSPTPEPLIAVFGADDEPSFSEGIAEEAAGNGIRVMFYPGGLRALARFEPEGAAAAIVFLADEVDELPRVGFPLYVYAARGQAVPEEVPHLSYASDGAAAEALARAISYPPHETPVRMLGLFTSKDSAAYKAWQSEIKAGRVYARASYVADDADKKPGVWLSERLDGLYPGMLDAIYAETGELAVAALDALLSRSRSDVDVFAASSDAGADRLQSALMPVVVGANLRGAGSLCYHRARALLFGGTVGSSQTAPEVLSFSPAAQP